MNEEIDVSGRLELDVIPAVETSDPLPAWFPTKGFTVVIKHGASADFQVSCSVTDTPQSLMFRALQRPMEVFVFLIAALRTFFPYQRVTPTPSHMGNLFVSFFSFSI
jgi:hypothetical protein